MPKTLSRLILWAVFVLVLFGGSAARQQALDQPHRTGLVPLSGEALAEVLATRARVTRVHPNWLGLDRINEVRRRKALPPLEPTAARPVGREVESAVGGLAADARIVGEAGALAADLPVAVDNSTLKYFPPIRDQGALGSCAAFAATYYQLSHMTALQRDLDIRNPADDTDKYSPKWTYNMVNGGTDTGSSFDQVYALLEDHGAATWAEFPYDDDFRAWCLDPSVWRQALPTRISPLRYIGDASSIASMEYMKELLADGFILVFGTSILSWQFTTILDDPSTEDDATEVGKMVGYWVNGEAGSQALVIVGYNDAIWTDVNRNGMIEAGERGAFRIANSWGPAWGDGGLTWLAYDALQFDSDVPGGPSSGRRMALANDIAWVLTARDSYVPSLVGEFTLNHGARSQLKLTLGRSDTGSTVPTTSWTPSVLQNQGGSFAFDGTTTGIDAGFVLDFSDILEEGTAIDRFYLGIRDDPAGGAAVLRDFKLVDLTTEPPTETVCPSVPKVVDGEQIDIYVDYDYAGPAYNHPPSLSDYWHIPGSTAKGTPSDPFDFRIRYYDQDGDPPAVRNVVIDGEPREMSLAWGLPADGEYVHETTLPLGRHSHFYSFEDGRGGSARSPFVGFYEGPAVYPIIIYGLRPELIRRGGAAFTLGVRGPSLVEGAVVRWDGSDRPTTWISEWELWASISALDIAEAGTVAITVRDPDGSISNPLPFLVYYGKPTIGGTSPQYATGGGNGFDLDVYGSPFLSNSVVFWNGTAKATTYVGPTLLRVQIAASEIQAGGENELKVLTPDPSSGLSAPYAFPVSYFQVVPPPSALVVRAGGSVSGNVTVRSVLARFDSPVTLSCPTLPKGVTASFWPASITPHNYGSSLMTLTTTAPGGRGAGFTGYSRPRDPLEAGYSLMAVLALFALWALSPRSSRRLARGPLLFIASLGLIALVFSCSSGGGGSSTDTGTPPGSYSFEVRGTSNGLSSSDLVVLIVN